MDFTLSLWFCLILIHGALALLHVSFAVQTKQFSETYQSQSIKNNFFNQVKTTLSEDIFLLDWRARF